MHHRRERQPTQRAVPRRRPPGIGRGTGRAVRMVGAPQTAPDKSMLEQFIERTLYASRWLLAPLYLGLSLALLALGMKFFQEVLHMLPHVFELAETELVLTVLSLIDMTLVGALLIMVMFSGYENFVSRIDLDEGADKLEWLGKYDAGTLKLKVAASIVAISSIHLLRAFMNAQQIPDNKLMWYVIIHMTFVFSALLLGFLDRMSFEAHRKH
jgi:uncharacterized protein (TIGR00645 family)